jgi:hypothetical protein
MTQAIITFAVGYTYEDIRYFIRSCEMNAPQADLYIFVGSNIKTIKIDCQPHKRVHLIQYREALFGKIVTKIFKLSKRTSVAMANVVGSRTIRRWVPSFILEAFAIPLIQFNVKRFFLSRRLLSKLPHQQIMITDIRDVLLLSNPFEDIHEHTILSGEEPILIEKSEMNRHWILKTYSQTILDRIGKLPVICAGVTIGSRKAMEQYSGEMIQEIYNQLPNIIDFLGADQAIHMKILYLELKGLQKGFEENGKGSIATLHFSKLSEFELGNGSMVNRSGRKLAVVHQYDRHKYLDTFLKELIESKNLATELSLV